MGNSVKAESRKKEREREESKVECETGNQKETKRL